MTRHTRMRQVRKLPGKRHSEFPNMTIERAKSFYTFAGDLDPTFVWKRMYTIRIGTHHHKVNYRHKTKRAGLLPVPLVGYRATLYRILRNRVEFKHKEGLLQLIGK